MLAYRVCVMSARPVCFIETLTTAPRDLDSRIFSILS